MTNRRTRTAGAAEPSASAAGSSVLGAVLAGGLGRRIGGAKAVVALHRRPLISYPLEAVWRALGNVAIVAKPDTELPNLPGATVWIEPAEPRHPLTGIIYALGLAGGRPLLVCAGDLPFVSPELIRELATADPRGHAAVVASAGGELQPLLGCFRPPALGALAELAQQPDLPLREAVAALDPVTYEVTDRELLFNVNTPDDLLQAAAMLDRRPPRATRK